MGTLYLVATPIGNLEDFSPRARRILEQVVLIAAEDTRHTGLLLKHFQIETHLTSYHEHNKLVKLDHILAFLERGDVALVSDAGTPGLNDPGYELVRAVIQAGFPVSPIPGPSAPLAALVASGLPTDSFLYLGYLPRKKADRLRLLTSVAKQPYTLVFLETPHRLLEALADLQATLGDRQMCAGREMTKVYEEFRRGSIAQVRDFYTGQTPRGEFTLVVAGTLPQPDQWDHERLETEIGAALERGESSAGLAARLSLESGWPRRKIYALILQRLQKPD